MNSQLQAWLWIWCFGKWVSHFSARAQQLMIHSDAHYLRPRIFKICWCRIFQRSALHRKSSCPAFGWNSNHERRNSFVVSNLEHNDVVGTCKRRKWWQMLQCSKFLNARTWFRNGAKLNPAWASRSQCVLVERFSWRDLVEIELLRLRWRDNLYPQLRLCSNILREKSCGIT